MGDVTEFRPKNKEPAEEIDYVLSCPECDNTVWVFHLGWFGVECCFCHAEFELEELEL